MTQWRWLALSLAHCGGEEGSIPVLTGEPHSSLEGMWLHPVEGCPPLAYTRKSGVTQLWLTAQEVHHEPIINRLRRDATLQSHMKFVKLIQIKGWAMWCPDGQIEPVAVGDRGSLIAEWITLPVHGWQAGPSAWVRLPAPAKFFLG